MSQTIDERLRAHFADRAAREPLPALAADGALARARAAASSDVGDDRNDQDGGAPPALVVPLGPPHGGVARLVRRHPARALAAAAAVALLAIAAGVVSRHDEPSNVSTEPSPITTAPADPTPSTAPSTVPSTGSTTPSTTDTTAAPTDGSRPTGPIVGVEGVLGTWSGDSWVPWELGATPPYGDEYDIVRLDEPITAGIGEPAADCSPVANPIVDPGLEHSSDKFSPEQIAVAGVADPRPRPVEVLDPSAPVYREAAAAAVAVIGIEDTAPQVVQVVRSDLDGDGSTEVVVVAERISDPVGLVASAGDYSVVFVRALVDGEVETRGVASWIGNPQDGMNPGAQVFRLSALADLNGDGRMEIVLNSFTWESSGTSVHEMLPGGRIPKVLEAGCGV